MFDINAYLARIDASFPDALDEHALAVLQFAHRRAIPFENIDVLLGREIHIDSAAVFQKLVVNKRGGYCFEQNQLFLDALDTIGFIARPLLARVWLGATATPSLTHCLSLVRVGGTQWIADAGFGGSFAPPLPLLDGAEVQTPEGALFHLEQRNATDWFLTRRSVGRAASHTGETAADVQYSFDLRDVFPADLALANYWTSTAPDSPFLQQQFVNAVIPTGFASLHGTTFKETSANGRSERAITTVAAYRHLLNQSFGITLDQADANRLGLFDVGD